MTRTFCVLCNRTHNDSAWRHKTWQLPGGAKKIGWACTRYFIPTGGKSDRKMREELATPFWKHMGLAPKPEEIAAERRMKWEGKTYLDTQRDRLATAKQTFDSTALKKKLFAGKLKSTSRPRYERKTL